MTEAEYAALEGITETDFCPPEFHFFVCENKREKFVELLRHYNIHKDIVTVKKGRGMFLFLLDIQHRADYVEVQDILNSQQVAFLR